MTVETNLAFNQNNLFQKAKIYVSRGLEGNREDDLFPFWISLALEFLARSTLAKISPTLLADCKKNRDDNLLYALNYQTTTTPTSISISEVFSLLTKININFTDVEKNLCESIVKERNTELHSGLRGFEVFPANEWLHKYYKVCEILLTSQGQTLEQYLGAKEAVAARLMIAEDAEKMKKVIFDNIEAFKKVYTSKDDESKLKLKQEAEEKIKGDAKKRSIVSCPSCNEKALLYGQIISLSEPRLISGSIEQEIRYLPTKFICYVCGLKIDTYAELNIASMGGQFTDRITLDPVDYHDIEVTDYIDIKELAAEYYGYDGYQDD